MNKGQEQTIVLAGGCFWGLQKLYDEIPGVIRTTAGYANGKVENCEAYANYEAVCSGETGFREAVEVVYDPDQVSLDTILFDFFYVIDPTVKNRQGNDVGTQYQSGIYWTTKEMGKAVMKIVRLEERRTANFSVEYGPLENFYPAEEYHQKYLNKNPGGYCHIPMREIEELKSLSIDPGQYRRPDDEEIRKMLTTEEYYITQQSGTERPYENPYWDKDEKGIYVDRVTGEPLFLSTDKFHSGCGWPAFSKPIEQPGIVMRRDLSHGMDRIEVRSRTGDTHLGHVFDRDPESPNGIRYCINSASLKFIPYDEMEKDGYGYLMDQVR